MRQVVAAGVSALGFGVAPVHQEVPPELVAACDRHGLPLLRLPPATPFVAVGQAAYAAIAEARNRELREISRAQSALATAATRPDALQAVLDRLSAHTGAWTVLYDAQGRELFSAGPRPSSPTPGRVRDLVVRTTARLRTGAAGRSAPAAAADHHGETHLTVHTLPGATAAWRSRWARPPPRPRPWSIARSPARQPFCWPCSPVPATPWAPTPTAPAHWYGSCSGPRPPSSTPRTRSPSTGSSPVPTPGIWPAPASPRSTRPARRAPRFSSTPCEPG
ncbi:PucR family transcriptional regulator ligand-binding domain-containing protein [Streptomyces sp. NBC_01340]|nr:PucR family transcriptional regulator ligand-binding domain-containing protein [Streptomyces sp. NBC_01340]